VLSADRMLKALRTDLVKDCSGVQSSGCATDNEQKGRDLVAKRGLGSKVSRTLEKESLRQKSNGV
jgi:hypothetical protein